MATLLDIPALRPLARLCRDYKIEFELFGGAVTRVVSGPGQSSFGAVNIFDLAGPFNDLDISHSGQPQLNAELWEALLDLIPNADCFRWDLRSRSEWAIYRTAAAYYNNRIPVRLMSLSTDPEVGLRDPLDGAGDIKRRQYRYERNVSYRASPLHRQRQDLEFFSGLLYLQALTESGLSPTEHANQASIGTVSSVMGDAKTVQTVAAPSKNSCTST